MKSQKCQNAIVNVLDFTERYIKNAVSAIVQFKISRLNHTYLGTKFFDKEKQSMFLEKNVDDATEAIFPRCQEDDFQLKTVLKGPHLRPFIQIFNSATRFPIISPRRQVWITPYILDVVKILVTFIVFKHIYADTEHFAKASKTLSWDKKMMPTGKKDSKENDQKKDEKGNAQSAKEKTDSGINKPRYPSFYNISNKNN
ncbi:hypothetical protein ABEB36_010688 [Hypothenemus hampei]|uniref:Uncharacterized protein n=1 Tax=Hypothenemus hampei TaxID=57062 RepID=A0ABD1EDG9_HYPHA